MAEFSEENCVVADQSAVMTLLPSKRDQTIQDLHRKMQEEKGYYAAMEQECLPDAELHPRQRSTFDDGFRAFITAGAPQLEPVLAWDDFMPSDTCFRCSVDVDSVNCATKKQVKPLRRLALALGDNTESIWKSSQLEKIDNTVSAET